MDQPPSRKRSRAVPLTQDFELLAMRYPEFSREWRSVQNSCNGKKKLASKATPSFQLALTRALLDYHFGLQLPSLPENRLCPPVPNRWFYCEWILHDLLPCISKHFLRCHDNPIRRGLDIGTGASAIYPLLMSKYDPQLRMVASEIDSVSLESARTNIIANNLQDCITLVQVDDATRTTTEMSEMGPLLQAIDKFGSRDFDFVMTNPPFFDQCPPDRADGRKRTPMTHVEGIYPGGEMGWALAILRDSLTLRTTIGWYTTMLSKKTSFMQLRRILIHFLGPSHVVFSDLDVGHMSRWFLAWTYHQPHGNSAIAQVLPGVHFTVQLMPCDDPLTEVVQRLKTYCETISDEWDLTCVVEHQDNSKRLIVTERSASTFNFSQPVESERLPEQVRRGKKDELLLVKDLLPREGHFLIYMDLTNAPNGVSVAMNSYRHSSHGGTVVEKILSRVEGEVCRTNRRWRRLLEAKKEK